MNLTETTASALSAGDHLHRVVKTPGRTRVFEDAIDARVLTVGPNADYPGYVTVVLDGGRTLNLTADRAVVKG